MPKKVPKSLRRRDRDELRVIDRNNAIELEDNSSVGSYEEPKRQSSGSRRSKSKSKEVTVYSGSEESDTEPLSQSFKAGKENQRLQSIMPSSKGRRSSDSASRLAEREAKKMKALEDAKNEQEAENARLKQQLIAAQAAAASVPRSKKKSQMTDEEKKWRAQVEDATKRKIWGRLIFINSDGKLCKATAKLFDLWDLKEFQGLVGDELEKAKVNWVANNKDFVRTGLIECKNYAQSQLRSAIVDRMIGEKDVPTPDEILDCGTREEYLHTDEKKQWIFEFYWDVLLFKVVGKDHWDTYIRHYKTISKAHHPNTPDQPCIPVLVEAFLVAVYRNCYGKWLYIAEENKNGNKYPDRKDPQFQVPFIDSDVGRSEWGGWNSAGRSYVKELANKIKDARERDHVEDMEDACLQRLRIAHQVEERDNKRKRKRGKARMVVEDEETDDEFEDI